MQEGRKVVNFGKINSNISLPNLIEIQVKSYEWFLQSTTSKRKNQGLQAVFEEIFSNRKSPRRRRIGVS